ncbi:MAG: hypothetical protein U0229_07525 [Anaeromyxobacter sp.]
MKPTLLGLLRIGFARGSRWRVLALFSGLALLPSIAGVAPLWAYLAKRLDAWPGAAALEGGFSTPIVMEVLFDGENLSRSITYGLAAALVLALLVGPWSAGAALAEARAAEPMRMRGLLASAGDLWGRMVRTLLVAAIPLGVAAAIAGGIVKAAEEAAKKVTLESAADARTRAALAAAAVVVFLAHLTLDAGRAHFAAEPGRRSAFLAWVAGAWLVIRRPVATIVVGAVGTGLALAVAAALLALRGRLPLWPAWSTVIGFVLATLATAAVAWGRSTRLAALAELAAWDGAERARKKALRAARKATRVAPTEPLLPAQPEPTPPPPAELEPRPLDVTQPVDPAPPKAGEG